MSLWIHEMVAVWPMQSTADGHTHLLKSGECGCPPAEGRRKRRPHTFDLADRAANFLRSASVGTAGEFGAGWVSAFPDGRRLLLLDELHCSGTSSKSQKSIGRLHRSMRATKMQRAETFSCSTDWKTRTREAKLKQVMANQANPSWTIVAETIRPSLKIFAFNGCCLLSYNTSFHCPQTVCIDE